MKNEETGAFRPFLEPFPIDTEEPRGAVLICPGGGYGGRAPHEGSVVARRFNADGFHAFVVQYRVAPHRYPAALQDVARALRIIRSRSAEWRVKPDHIAVLGFSAGGHLAGTSGVHFDEGDPAAADPIDRISCRPDALVLCYPVISSGEFGNQGSFNNLLGTDANEEMRTLLSLEKQVRPNTPPAFLWHTSDDSAVPVENSLLFAQALRRRQISFELHVLPNGRHGLGLAPDQPEVGVWVDLCSSWLKRMGW
ncbi:alpha/beta hydrolase [bacterium]|nr:alpha/beta hydrolase [bacterium]